MLLSPGLRRRCRGAFVGLVITAAVLPAPLASAASAGPFTGSLDPGSSTASLAPSGLADADNADWMSALPDDVALPALSLPGTHDTMASRASVFAETQDTDLPTQLRAGVRALDIRNRHFRDAFPIHHGVEYLDANFTDVVVQVTDFLRAHPSETVVMRLKEEFTPAENTRSYEDTLDWYRSGNPETRDRLQQHLWQPASTGYPRLGAVRGKIVVLRDFAAERWSGPRFGDASMDVQDTYELSGLGDVERKWGLVRAQFEDARAGSPGLLFVNHLSATGSPAGMATGTLPVTVARGVPGTPGILDRAEAYLRSEPAGRVGIVMADFPTAALVESVIAHNFR